VSAVAVMQPVGSTRSHPRARKIFDILRSRTNIGLDPKALTRTCRNYHAFGAGQCAPDGKSQGAPGQPAIVRSSACPRCHKCPACGANHSLFDSDDAKFPAHGALNLPPR
jgi:hypothetical protein